MGHLTGKANRYYSKEEKVRKVREVLGGKSSKEVGRETGINARLIRQWVTLYLDHGEQAQAGQSFMQICKQKGHERNRAAAV